MEICKEASNLDQKEEKLGVKLETGFPGRRNSISKGLDARKSMARFGCYTKCVQRGCNLNGDGR